MGYCFGGIFAYDNNGNAYDIREYFLRIIAGNKMFEKIKFMIENGNTFDEIKDFMQGGITDDEGENFYT